MVYLRFLMITTIILVFGCFGYFLLSSEKEAHFKKNEEAVAVPFEEISEPSQIQLYSSYIDQGFFLKARQGLEELAIGATEEEKDEIYFMLGLSYLKEAQDKPVSVSTPYYKLAFTYFQRLPRGYVPYERVRIPLIKELTSQAENLIEEKSLRNLPFYLEILERSGSEEEMEQIGLRLEEEVDRAITQNNLRRIQEFSQVFSGTSLGETFRKRFELMAEQALIAGDFETLNQYWNVAQHMSGKSEELSDRFADEAAEIILRVISNDDAEFTQTTPYFEFWNQREKDHDQRLSFANQLIDIASKLWSEEEQSKAIAVMAMAKEVPYHTEKGQIHQLIEQKVGDIYQRAIRSDQIEELFFVFEAVKELNLKNIPIYDQGEIENSLEDAHFHLVNNQFDRARKFADWVLKLEPDNPGAKEILGMIAYRDADYPLAFRYLKNLQTENLDFMEAQAVTEILLGDREKGLTLLENVTPSDQIYLHLGFGSLVTDNPIESRKWFEKVQNKNDEVLAGLCYASFATKDWEKALDLLNQLNPSYNRLEGFQGIAVESLLELGKESDAEVVLKNLLKREPLEGEESFSPAFLGFKKTKLDPWNRYFVAALFYKDFKKDPIKAISFFDQIENPTPLALVEKAETLIEIGMLYEAQEILEPLLKKDGEIKSTVLTLLATIDSDLKQYPDALPYFKEYFFLNPRDETLRSSYANVLMHIQRYDLALKQFDLLKKSRQLTSLERVRFIDCLVHTEKFEEANKVAEKWISDDSLTFLHQLQVAQSLIISRNAPLVKTILSHSPQNDSLSIKEQKELLNLRIDFGDYAAALEMVREIESILESSPEGLMILAKLYWNLSQDEKALKLANRAFALDPLDLSIIDSIEEFSHHHSLEQHKQHLSKRMNRVTYQLAYASDLIELSIEKLSEGEYKSIEESFDIHRADAVLKKLSEEHQDIPEIFFLQGKVRFLLDDNTGADEAFMKALHLDVSYIDVYQHLALIYEEEKQLNDAAQILLRALKFAPNDTEVWQQLTQLYIDLGNYNDGITALLELIKYRPNAPENYFKLAELQLELKNPESALVNVDRGLELAPNDKQGLRLLLMTLYDPNLLNELDNGEAVRERQESAYQALYAIDPEEATKLKKE